MKKTNWSGICATSNNRNQCGEDCVIFPICKIKIPRDGEVKKQIRKGNIRDLAPLEKTRIKMNKKTLNEEIMQEWMSLSDEQENESGDSVIDFDILIGVVLTIVEKRKKQFIKEVLSRIMNSDKRRINDEGDIDSEMIYVGEVIDIIKQRAGFDTIKSSIK